MAVLTGSAIVEHVMRGNIVLTPFNPQRAGPNSYDLTLGDGLRVYTDETLDCRRESPTREIEIPEDGLVLRPGQLYLGTTLEYVGSKLFVPTLHGRSSAGRLGMVIHFSAGLGDVGWFGEWTLEISVLHPLRIYPRVSICQVVFQTAHGNAQLYAGKYQDQRGAAPSKMWADWARVPPDASFPISPPPSQAAEALLLASPNTKRLALLPWDFRYVISDQGDVISFVREPRCLRQRRRDKKDRYPTVEICQRKKFHVHRLVAASFLGPPPMHERVLVRHLNDNPQDVRAENLAYGTNVENMADAARNGKIARGADSATAKLTDENVREIRRMRGAGKLQREIAEHFGVNTWTVARILNGQAWAHVRDE